MEELEEVEVVVKMAERCGLGGSEGGVASVDDGLEVFRWDLGGGYVEGEDLVGEFGEREVLPVLPVVDLRDVLGDEKAAVAGEALENDLLEGELESRSVSWVQYGLGDGCQEGNHIRHYPLRECSGSAATGCGCCRRRRCRSCRWLYRWWP